uniref:transporter n=1 Tax=Polaribacter sp. TaxID=1920175 RepID=UPI0040478154
MSLLSCFLAYLFLLISSFCFGQTISTDRPDQTESATLVGLKSLQLESGILFSFANESFGNIVRQLVHSILLRYGFSKKIELRLYQEHETNRFDLQNQAISGLKNLQIGLKLLLFQKHESPTEITIISHVIVPTGSKKIDQNTFGIINKLAFSHRIGEQLNISYNLGYDFRGKNSSKGTYALAFGIKLSDAFGMYA